MASLRSDLVRRLEKIPGLTDRPSKVAGGSAIFFGEKEIAHFHHDHEIDLRLTAKLIKREGLKHNPDSKIHARRAGTSQWIELPFHSAKDIAEVARLFKIAVTEAYTKPKY